MPTNHEVWFSNNIHSFRLLSKQIQFVLESLLQQNNIDYLSVDSRTKSILDIKEKIKRKEYSDPVSSMTDISGVRIILFLDEDIKEVEDIIRSDLLPVD